MSTVQCPYFHLDICSHIDFNSFCSAQYLYIYNIYNISISLAYEDTKQCVLWRTSICCTAKYLFTNGNEQDKPTSQSIEIFQLSHNNMITMIPIFQRRKCIHKMLLYDFWKQIFQNILFQPAPPPKRSKQIINVSDAFYQKTVLQRVKSLQYSEHLTGVI